MSEHPAEFFPTEDIGKLRLNELLQFMADGTFEVDSNRSVVPSTRQITTMDYSLFLIAHATDHEREQLRLALDEADRIEEEYGGL